MGKSISEFVKESLINGIDTSDVKPDELTDRIIAVREALRVILEELDEEKEEEFIPEFGDVYWVVNFDGEATVLKWIYDSYDKCALANNAIFKTEEEAEFEAERLKVLRELEKMGRAFIPERDNYSLSLQYDFIRNEVMFRYVPDFDIKTVYGNYYFDTLDDVKKAINKIGEDRIKKYLFGIEE